MKTRVKLLAWLGVGLAVCVANAQYQSDFEALDASPEGVILTGQDGYYIPPGTVSTDYLAFTYAGNVLGLPQNPYGGLQFVGGVNAGEGVYARAQRDMTYGDGTGVWTVTYDFAGTWLGTGASSQYLGSFSTQLYPGEATYIHLMSWVDELNPTSFNAWYYAYDEYGATMPLPGLSPGPEWDSLPLNHWYRSTTTFDLDINRIIEVGIEDLETGASASYEPSDWYLEGGAAGGSPPPSGLRFFTGGYDPIGNALGWDNINIVPEPASLSLLVLTACVVLRRR